MWCRADRELAKLPVASVAEQVYAASTLVMVDVPDIGKVLAAQHPHRANATLHQSSGIVGHCLYVVCFQNRRPECQAQRLFRQALSRVESAG